MASGAQLDDIPEIELTLRLPGHPTEVLVEATDGDLRVRQVMAGAGSVTVLALAR